LWSVDEEVDYGLEGGALESRPQAYNTQKEGCDSRGGWDKKNLINLEREGRVGEVA
jgi:hypothetical protein